MGSCSHPPFYSSAEGLSRLSSAHWGTGLNFEGISELTNTFRDFPGGPVVKNLSSRGFPGGAVVENPPANAGDTGSSPGLGRSHMPRSN